MSITSFKTTSDLYNLNNFPFFFTEKPTLDQLRLLFQQTLFLRWLANTAFVGFCRGNYTSAFPAGSVRARPV